LTPVQSGEFGRYTALVLEFVLTFSHSALTGYAGRVQGVLIFGGLCLRTIALELMGRAVHRHG
jgi:hypothetical protein